MQEIDQIVNTSNNEIESLENSPFTKKGFSEYRNNISEYIEDLFQESLKISKRNRTELISASHVKTASFYLIKKSKSRTRNLYNSIGGLLLGVTISNLVSIVALNLQYNKLGLVVIVFLGIIGSFLLSLGTIKN
jgi:hypothetical protein